MSLFAIGDFHLSGEPPAKPMEVFNPAWANHFEKIRRNWLNMITPEDTVIICGDTSWAMSLDAAMQDLNRIAALPGRKIILRGNHDYWWTSLKKMQQATADNFMFLQNNFFTCGDVAVCGSRGWLLPSSDNFTEDDRHIYEREGVRLELSLAAAKEAGFTKFVVAMHYPPLYKADEVTVFTELFARYGVTHCVFGHIHGQDAANVFEGETRGVTYKLTSCDTQNFTPQLILP